MTDSPAHRQALEALRKNVEAFVNAIGEASITEALDCIDREFAKFDALLAASPPSVNALIGTESDLGRALAARPAETPPPLWQHAVTECNEAHAVLDALDAPTSKTVRRVRGPEGDEEVTVGLAERIRSLWRRRA